MTLPEEPTEEPTEPPTPPPPAAPMISWKIGLQPSVTVEQYQEILNVIQEGASRYSHLITDIQAENIPPITTTVPVQVAADGITNVALRDALRLALEEFVSDMQPVKVKWWFADEVNGV